MNQIIDFQGREVAIGQQSLPLNLALGGEILLTSLFLSISSANVTVKLDATVGWQAQLSLLPLTSGIIFRLRRGGFTPADPLLYQTTDAELLSTGNLILLLTGDFTTTFHHVDHPDASLVGTFQGYYLTAELTGTGATAITGPVTLLGEVVL